MTARIQISRTEKLIQYTASLLFAVCFVFSLAWFMSTLISKSEMQLSKVEKNQMLDFVRMKRSESVQRKNRKPKKPTVVDAPETPAPQNMSSAGAESLTVNFSSDTGVTQEMNSGFGIASNSEYLPIVKIAPLYPRSAMVKNITGTCMVQYTVTTLGTVKDVKVVKEQCLESVFMKPSINAALGFKYKPRIIDGEAVEVIGVQNRFIFELNNQANQKGKQ